MKLSHETGLGSNSGTSSAGLRHRAANLSFLQCHLAALARPAAGCSWLGTTSHPAGLFLCWPVCAAGSLLQAGRVLTGTNTAPEGLQHPPGHIHAPHEVERSVVPRGELPGVTPAPSPSRCPSWLRVNIHGSSVHAPRGTQNAGAAKRRAPRHVSVVRHGLLKSDTSGAAVSQFLSADGPGLVFPSAFLAACKLAAPAWRFSPLPCVRVCVCFFLPSWAQL